MELGHKNFAVILGMEGVAYSHLSTISTGGGEGIIIPFYHFHSLSNIRTFVCSFESVVTTFYLQLQCLLLPVF